MQLDKEKTHIDKLILKESIAYYKKNSSKFLKKHDNKTVESCYDNLLHHMNLLLKLNMKEPEENTANHSIIQNQNQSISNQGIPFYETKFEVQNLIDYEKKIQSESLIKLWNTLATSIQYNIFSFLY